MGSPSQTVIEALLGPIFNREDAVFPPMETIVLHSDDGTVFVPHSFDPGRRQELFLSRGVGISWTPFPETGGALIVMAGGNPIEPSDEAIAFTLSPNGLKAMIRSLQSIDHQMDGA